MTMKNKLRCHNTLFSGESHHSSANLPSPCSQSLAGKPRAGRRYIINMIVKLKLMITLGLKQQQP